jgi:hypothetical protein
LFPQPAIFRILTLSHKGLAPGFTSSMNPWRKPITRTSADAGIAAELSIIGKFAID